MKKGIRESNPVLALWQRIRLDGRISKLAKKLRKELGIPEGGFKSFEEFDVWYTELEIRKDTKKMDSVGRLFNEKFKEIIPYEGIIRDISLQLLTFKYLYFGKIENEYLDSLKDSGMQVVTVKNSKHFDPLSKKIFGEISDGVYLKIRDFSTIDSILKYIKNNKDFIRNSLSKYAESENIIKPKRIKASSHFSRDYLILYFDGFSKKELELNFGVKAKYKENAISTLMNGMGEKGVTLEVIKAVKQRRKMQK